MHLLIPFAVPLSVAGRQAAASLQLPHLQQLLACCTEAGRDDGDAWSLSPPHERALAQALGWQAGDGLLPLAARAAQQDGIAVGAQAWGLLTPVHWHVGTDQVTLTDPAALQLSDDMSRQLFNAVQELFTSEGFGMHHGAPLRWYITHDSLAAMPAASLDRVVGRSVDAWLDKGASGTAGRRLRRLQNEVQMLLHTHPLNDAREAQGLLPVNSFWLSGCGQAQAARGMEPTVDDRLRAPALADDWAAWAQAWEALDGGPLATLALAAQRADPVQLTLCGEQSSARFQAARRGVFQRLAARWSAPPLQAVWASL